MPCRCARVQFPCPPASADRMPSQPSSPEVAVIGGGPAGLIAAEVLGRAGVSVTVYDRMPSVGRKLLMAGRGGLNLTHSRGVRALPRPLCRGRAAAAAPDRGLPSGGPARLVRGPGPGDLRRLERARVPEGLQGLAAPARLAVAAGGPRRPLRPAPSLAGLGRRTALSSSPMRPASRCRSSPTPPSWRSAARAGRGSARTAPGSACWPGAASPSRPCGRPIWASPIPGPRSCAAASRASP